MHAATSALDRVSVSTRTLTSQGIGFLETLKNPSNLFKNNLINTGNNRKSQIQKEKKKNKKTNCGILELLIPTFFQKKASHERKKTFFAQNNYGKIALNWRTNGQIIARFGRSFINDKFIFQ